MKKGESPSSVLCNFLNASTTVVHVETAQPIRSWSAWTKTEKLIEELRYS